MTCRSLPASSSSIEASVTRCCRSAAPSGGAPSLKALPSLVTTTQRRSRTDTSCPGAGASATGDRVVDVGLIDSLPFSRPAVLGATSLSPVPAFAILMPPFTCVLASHLASGDAERARPFGPSFGTKAGTTAPRSYSRSILLQMPKPASRAGFRVVGAAGFDRRPFGPQPTCNGCRCVRERPRRPHRPHPWTIWTYLTWQSVPKWY
jgi:hypothetical protein